METAVGEAYLRTLLIEGPAVAMNAAKERFGVLAQGGCDLTSG
jgi:hypothetical protein